MSSSSQDIEQNEFLATIKGHNSGTYFKMMCNNTKLDHVNINALCNDPKLDLANMNAYIKFGENLSICSQDIERKQNFGVNQGL